MYVQYSWITWTEVCTNLRKITNILLPFSGFYVYLSIAVIILLLFETLYNFPSPCNTLHFVLHRYTVLENFPPPHKTGQHITPHFSLHIFHRFAIYLHFYKFNHTEKHVHYTTFHNSLQFSTNFHYFASLYSTFYNSPKPSKTLHNFLPLSKTYQLTSFHWFLSLFTTWQQLPSLFMVYPGFLYQILTIFASFHHALPLSNTFHQFL